MANKEHLEILDGGKRKWNKWRNENPEVEPDLQSVQLSREKLLGANLSNTDLTGANLRGTFLLNANLSHSNLTGADLSGAVLVGADLSYANLEGAVLRKATLERAKFYKAILDDADLHRAEAYKADFRWATLRKSDLMFAKLIRVNLRHAKLSASKMRSVNLYKADLSYADLIGADLTGAAFVKTNLKKAKLNDCRIYGISAWDLEGEDANQKDLIVTPEGNPIVTVDNIKVAQFIYLILNNQEIRDVINTLTSKSVLILGRFSVPKRKGILDALKKKLREHNLLPIVFDFDRPVDRDFTETIKTLAGLSYFVIADITNPKSSPLELQAVVPDYQIPFVPIIQDGEEPFSMMANLQSKYRDWVLDTLYYDSKETLIKVLKKAVIDPAMEKHIELQFIKAKKSGKRIAKDYL